MRQQRCRCKICMEKKGKEQVPIFKSIQMGKTHVCAAHHKQAHEARDYLEVMENSGTRISRIGDD